MINTFMKRNMLEEVIKGFLVEDSVGSDRRYLIESSSQSTIYVDNGNYKFQIQGGKLMLVGRPNGNKAGLPKQIQPEILQDTVAELISRYPNDAALAKLSGKSTSTKPTTKTSTGAVCPKIGVEVKSAADVYSNLVRSGAIDSSATLVLVDGRKQRISVIKNGAVVKSMLCSTSATGFGNTSPNPESGPTATGLMEVSDIIGAGEPVGTVFKRRRKTGQIVRPNTGSSAFMTTRILRLSGLQDENDNVSSRGIYIHGTNLESRLGRKASHGCIRVSNADVLWLESNAPVGSYVYVWGDPITSNPEFPCSMTNKVKDYAGQAYDYVKDLF